MKLRIGDWMVEPAANEISTGNRTVKLEPKAMAVLTCLADSPGKVVSRETLLSSAWPGVVVVDDSLTQVVLKLRKALGDEREKPTYIQTIAKGGYRLVAPVVRSSPTPPRVAPMRRIAAAALGVLLVGGVTVWWLASELAPGVATGRAPAAATERNTDKPTVAIRPFEALGNDPLEALLARGITEDLVTDLSKVFGLWVVGSEAPAGVALPADEPPIHYLVTGSVQRIGERLRLTVHLADARTGKQLWSQRFDHALGELHVIQAELGPKILGALPARVSEAELRRMAQGHTHSIEAYELFQRGQVALLARQRAENETAREMFRRAIALDPTFARAYAALALTYAADYRNQWTADGPAALDRALEIARSAYQMNPDIPETYWVMAFAHVERRQHEQALEYLKAAVAANPSFADGYALMGGVYTYIGRPEESVVHLRTALRLNPAGGHLYFLTIGRAYLFLGDLEQARVNLDQAVSRNFANLETHIYLAVLYVTLGDKAAADWEAQEIRTLKPGFTARGWLETYPMTDTALRKRLENALGEIGL